MLVSIRVSLSHKVLTRVKSLAKLVLLLPLTSHTCDPPNHIVHL